MSNKFIIMGVCGTGKTTLGLALAKTLGIDFCDGDDLHPAANIDKMSRGIPLNDHDRQPWLETIRDKLHANSGQIIACSALKQTYRNTLREGNAGLKFIFLQGDKKLIQQRLEQRQRHYMASNMLTSQLATLEPPATEEDDVVWVDIQASTAQQLASILKQLH